MKKQPTHEQAVKVAVSGMFDKADRKLSHRLKRRGRRAAAKAAERRIELRHHAIKAST
ncbi:MAG: hypothetical protein OXN97_05445 [Bryobacterales bacterium]|nr:hypothetical protein [Bryobacterales bacterium]